MNFVVWIQGFDFLLPVVEREAIVVIDGDLFRFQIDVHRRHAGKVFADILDEPRASFAVNAGDGHFGGGHG